MQRKRDLEADEKEHKKKHRHKKKKKPVVEKTLRVSLRDRPSIRFDSQAESEVWLGEKEALFSRMRRQWRRSHNR